MGTRLSYAQDKKRSKADSKKILTHVQVLFLFIFLGFSFSKGL
jgi:hypothetical protein